MKDFNTKETPSSWEKEGEHIDRLQEFPGSSALEMLGLDSLPRDLFLAVSMARSGEGHRVCDESFSSLAREIVVHGATIQDRGERHTCGCLGRRGGEGKRERER